MVEQENEPPLTRDDIEAIVGMLDAQLLIVHLNVLEELVQPEGDTNMIGLLSGIETMISWSPVPVVVKETGAGMSQGTALAITVVPPGTWNDTREEGGFLWRELVRVFSEETTACGVSVPGALPSLHP